VPSAAEVPSTSLGAGSGATPRLALFPAVTASYNGIAFVFQNEGGATLRTRDYGQPGYRVIAKLFDNAKQIGARWVELPRDLAPGEQTSVTIPIGNATRVRFYHALQGIPIIDETPFAELSL
jgi:hypothetical protein